MFIITEKLRSQPTRLKTEACSGNEVISLRKLLIVSVLGFILLLTLMPRGVSAIYTHQNLTLTVLVNGQDTSLNGVKTNPLVIDLSQPIKVDLAMSNTGDTIHLTDMSVTFYSIQKILFWDMEAKVYTHQVDLDEEDKDGDGKEGVDIPAGTESESFEIAPEDIAEYRDQLSGQKVRIDLLFNFEDIPDYTIKVYINFV